MSGSGRSGGPGEFAIDPALESAIPRDGRGSTVSVGTFDGVHRGHREVLQGIVERARRAGRRSVLATFHPHPLSVVRPEHAPPLLSTPAEKREILAETGLEYAVFLPFTRVLQQYPARRFVEEILVGRLRMAELVIGYDHGFGRGREGGVDTLREIGRELRFDVEVIGPIGGEGDPISSTKIRRALAAGEVAAAAEGLGRPYSFEGRVVHGEKRGRLLGFPTANLRLDLAEKMLPLEGIYAVRASVGSMARTGLLHLGPRPVFARAEPTVEVYLMDFEGDLYGRRMKVELCERLRGIEDFGSEEALVARMRDDERRARASFGTGPDACA